jgi:ATP/maltotriose-dependent transcriptional regulator MalT
VELLDDHLVGRAAELDRLVAALAGLERDQSAAIELLGEAGIGKTRLLAEFGDRVEADGVLVLGGRGAEQERDLPFWVFVDALDEYVEGLEPRRLRGLDDEVRAELGQVFPSLSTFVTGGRSTLQIERYRMHRAVRELLERLAATTPLVLVLDDFHWADDASAELVGALLRRPPAARVLIVLAARPQQLPKPVTAALDRAHRERILERIELGPLTRSEALELIGQPPGDPMAAALYDESGGNPFYLEQLARSSDQPTVGARVADDVSLAGVRVPPMVAAALTEELSMLAGDARLVLDGASVAGDPFEPDLAASAAGVSETSVVEALDELLRCDLVRVTEVPRRFQFRHPIVRRAVYEATPGGWRLGAHERVAESLSARGASIAALAHHVEHSARQGDLAAVAVLRDAGDDAAGRAPASAARWFAGALRLLPATAAAEDRIALLFPRAQALAATGQFAESHDALLECLALVSAHATATRARLTAACAAVEHLLGDHEQAHARLAGALNDLAEAASPDGVALMIELAGDAIFRLQYETAQDWGRRALAAARPLGDRSLTAAALAVLARSLAWGGVLEAGETNRMEAAALIDSLSDEELARRLDAAVNLAGAEIYLDRFIEAGAHAERAVAVGRATGQGQLFPGVFATLGVAWCTVGRLREAAELLDAAIEGARLSGNTQALAWVLFCRSFVAVPAGDAEIAVAAAQESLDLTQNVGESVIAARAALMLAVALLQTRQPARAAEVLASSAGGEQVTLVPDVWRAYGLQLMTSCWIELGRRSDAERAAAGAHASAAAVGLRLPTAMAQHAAAVIALDADDPAGAAASARAAAALADEVGAPVWAATARTLAGRALAQLGERDQAVAELETAAAELQRCGAKRYRDAAERELRQLGHHIHRRTRPGKADGSGIESLTERELQISRLVVDRKTNREIAAELYLSQKTVETHLRNIFRKLDADSRVDVARILERADRLEQAEG